MYYYESPYYYDDAYEFDSWEQPSLYLSSTALPAYEGVNSIRRIQNGFEICLSKRVVRILALTGTIFSGAAVVTLLNAFLPFWAVIPVLLFTSALIAYGRDAAVLLTKPLCATVTFFPSPSIQFRVQTRPTQPPAPVVLSAPTDPTQTQEAIARLAINNTPTIPTPLPIDAPGLEAAIDAQLAVTSDRDTVALMPQMPLA